MAGERSLKIRFTGDTSGLDRAARQAAGAMQKWSVKNQALGVATGIGMAGAGRALFRFGKESVAAFAGAEQAQAQLADAFARFPALADVNIGALQRLNTAMERKVKFDDDALASGQAILANFKLSGRQIAEITPLLADYAAKTGREIPDAATTLGRAFLGNAKALKEIGIAYKSTGNQALDTANITKLLRDQVGGFAEKQGKTAAGQAAILGNQFEEIQETIGAKLTPALMTLAAWGLKTIDWLQRNWKIMGPLIGVIGTIIALQYAWNLAMSLNPIGLIIIGIAALIAIIALVATKTKFFQTIWRVAWGGVKAAAVAVWDWIKALPGRIGDAFGRIAGFITAPFRMEFNAVARLWNNTIGKLSFKVPDWVPGLGGKGFSMPNLPTYHGGGIVRGPAGSDQIIRAQAGELVTPANQVGRPMVLEAHIHIGGEVVRVVRSEIKEANRSLRRSVLAGAGAR